MEGIMLLRRLSVLGALLVALAVPAATAGPASAAPARPALTVGGTVANPASYTASQLAALPAETIQLRGPGGRAVAATGVSLDLLVTTAAPVLPAAKNALLRVIVTASGPFGPRVSFALGELDANFGDHDAVVVLSVGGRPLPAPALAVPGDLVPLRDLPVVNSIKVGVTNPAVTVPPSAGALVVEAGSRQVILPAAALAALPQQTRTVTFLAGAGAQTHTETGPALSAVLGAARLPQGLNTWVAAVGSDGYVATVTPAEAWVGGRPLLISLAEDGTALAAPRLVADGDVKGGRYVSGVYDLIVGAGAPGELRNDHGISR
jgi:hypothetical protein